MAENSHATAHAGDILTLDATATDAAGNTATAARVLLPIADLNPPTLRLRTTTGALDIVPGSSVTVFADGEDETGINAVTLAGQGSFSVNQAKQVSPVSNSIHLPFPIAVPAGATDGSVLNLSATATDIFGNISAPATLALTVRSGVTVTLPLSLIVAAGDTAPVVVQLGTPAPAGGVIVDLRSADTNLAQITAQLAFAQGESSKQATVSGLAGGSVTLTASVGGVTRASMTATVRGGIVSGIVRNPQAQPVSGATVTLVDAFGNVFSAVTEADGSYIVEGVDGGQFAVTNFAIRVSDPVTQLIGFATGSLNTPHGFAHVNIFLVTAGSIGGTVFAADGTTPAGAGARVDLFAANDAFNSLASVFTDSNGVFGFPIVSPGSYVVEASDLSGNRGRATAIVISATGQHVNVPVVYLGRGIVAGTVRNGSNNPAPNVALTFTSTSIFGQTQLLANSGPDGTFRFDGVFIGSFAVQARDPVTGLAGTASGNIQSNLQVVTVDVHLAQWGGLQGVVFRSDAVTPVAGANVSVFGAGASLQTTTDNAGHYALDALPLGQFSVTATEAATRGVGRVLGALTANGQTVTQNITFFPQGALVVTVVDSNGGAAPFAQVNVSSSNNLAGDGFQVTTDATGIIVVEHVLASNSVSVSARANDLTGSLLTTLQANEIKPITVRLEATATLAGTVYLPDGQTPAAGVPVTCVGCGSAVTADDGTYRFEGVRLGTWNIEVKDSTGRKRALGKNLRLTANGQILTTNLTFVGLGVVTGRVLNPDNSSAPNLFVQVRSLDPDFGGYSFPKTDAGGFYRAEGVAVGSITVSTGDTARGLLGEAFGNLARDGDTVNLDILLKNNAITLPVNKADGNLFPFDVQRDGSIAQGASGVFASQQFGVPGGASLLDLVSGGAPTRFTGGTIGTTEANGREIVISQSNLAGLNVSRKVLVSSNYFARYLEILTNPTANSITVDVRVQSNVRATGVVSTSSGDAVFNVTDPSTPDRWVMLNTSEDTDPFASPYFTSVPQVGFAFGGPGALQSTGFGTFAIQPFTYNAGQVNYGWSNVTVQPGQTVAFMHFGLQQYNRAALQASLTRLTQLPPEALESLSPAEIAQIRNFAIPADGTSGLAALPPLGGTVTGRVFEADQTTLAPTANSTIGVRLRSSVIYFGRTYHTGTNAGATFTYNASTLGQSFAFPIADFTVQADHRITNVTSATTNGSFGAGATSASANVVFSNAGIVKGVVKRTSGALVAGAQILVSGQSLFANYPVTGADGSYVAGGIVPGTYTVRAGIPHPQNTQFLLTATAAVDVVAGATRTVDLEIQPTGTGTGVVRTAVGAPAVGISVELRGIVPNDNFTSLRATTDSSGTYRFNDAPVGSFTVRATDPLTGFFTSAPVVVSRDLTSAVNLTLLAVGSVELTVTYANGLPAANAYVEIQKPALDQYFRGVGSTDANGHITLTNVPAGQFGIRAHRSSDFYSTVDVGGSINTQNQVLPLTAVLPPIGSAIIRVTQIGGAPVSGSQVDTDAYTQNYYSNVGSTDANGELRLDGVQGPITFNVRARDPQTNQARAVTASLTGEGQIVIVPITLNTFGSASGKVTTTTGTPVVGVYVSLVSGGGEFGASVQTDGSGSYAFTRVPVGVFRARVFDQSNGRFGSVEAALAQDGDAAVADITMDSALLNYTLTDANGSNYVVQSTAGISGSTNADGFFGFARMLVSPSGTDAFRSFNGDQGGRFELNGRQLSVRNFDNQSIVLQPLVGLNVTRKFYVDPAGYFGRSLEVFQNPTAAPISIDVDLSGNVNADRVTATSSGDATLDAADQWFVTDYTTQPQAPHDAFVFAGAGAALPPTTVSPDKNFSSNLIPHYRWTRLTVPAGGRAILMHFISSSADDAAARATAVRLAQLPPEALAGLTAADAAAIVNFAVPADLSSPVAPFGAVTGRVLAGSTPLPGASVLVGGGAAVYKPIVTVQADANGVYRAQTLDSGPFTVQARDPNSGELSLVTSLTLDPAQSSISQDLVIAALGVLRGAVTFASGAAVGGGQVLVSGGSPAVNISVPIGADGTYATALRNGTYTVQVSIGNRYTTISGVIVTIDHTTIADIRLPAIADVRVTLTRTGGIPVDGVPLYLSDSAGYRFSPSFTDGNGVAIFYSVREGPFSVLYAASGETFSGAVVAANDGQTIDVAFTSQTASIRGTVRNADNTLASTGYVQVGPSRFRAVAYGYIGADGTYAIDGVTPGTYIAFATVNGSVAETAPFVVAPGQNAVVDITLPATATVRVTVQNNGAGVPNTYVYINDAAGFRFIGFTDANGQRLIPNVREGSFTIQVYSFGAVTLNLQKSGTITAADNNHTVDVRFALTGGTITGQVFVADGVTPAPNVSVTVHNPDTGAQLTSTVAGLDGRYSVNVATDGSAFRVTAHSPGDYNVTASFDGSFLTDPAPVVNLTLPVGLLRGRVFYADGITPASDGSVLAAQKAAVGEVATVSATVQPDGTYAVAGVLPGTVEILAKERSANVTARATVDVAAVTSPVNVDVVLSGSGVVTGVVRNASGALVAAAVTMRSDAADANGSYVNAAADGVFTVDPVPLGPFSLEACFYNTTTQSTLCGSAIGEVTVAGQTIVRDITLPQVGSVSGTVFAPNGFTPAPSMDVTITGGADGPAGAYQGSATTDGNGQFHFDNVPVGKVSVAVHDPNTYDRIGASLGTVTAGGALTLNVRQGTSFEACYESVNLPGADAFLYDPRCFGELRSGGTVDRHLTNAYAYRAYELLLNGLSPSTDTAAASQLAGRAVLYGPMNLSGVEATRQIFVPAAGHFARYLETLTNSTATDVTLAVQIRSALAGAVDVIVDSAATSNTYAVTLADQSGSIKRPSLAHVFAGPLGTVPASNVRFQRLIGPSQYEWRVTIPAGQSITLMHFAIQREPNDTAGAEAQAQALVNLTDPDALTGMTAADKARVLNFKIP